MCVHNQQNNLPNISLPPQYDFDGAASPNADHLATFQVQPLKTTQGTIILALSPEDFAAVQAPLSLNVEGAVDDEFEILIRGDVANAPHELDLLLGGALSWRARTPANLLNPNLNILGFTSDGPTVRSFFNGEEIVLATLAGANTGQWFASAIDANVFVLGCRRQAVQANPYDGSQQFYIQYDRPLSPDTIAKIYYDQIHLFYIRLFFHMVDHNK